MGVSFQNLYQALLKFCDSTELDIPIQSCSKAAPIAKTLLKVSVKIEKNCSKCQKLLKSSLGILSVRELELSWPCCYYKQSAYPQVLWEYYKKGMQARSWVSLQGVRRHEMLGGYGGMLPRKIF